MLGDFVGVAEFAVDAHVVGRLRGGALKCGDGFGKILGARVGDAEQIKGRPLRVRIRGGALKHGHSLRVLLGVDERLTVERERADAERSFNAAIKADPKNTPALFYLGRIAYEQKNWDSAIAMFNRATTADAHLADAWKFLTLAYINRGAAATDAKADADYLNAVRASEGLVRAKPADVGALALNGQALIYAKQYAQAVPVLERATANANAQGPTLYLLGIAYSRTKNFPKAIATFERAAAKTPDDANVYRELGYAYEVSKQYAKALAAYQKGSTLAPDDADLKQSVERVRPFAK